MQHSDQLHHSLNPRQSGSPLTIEWWPLPQSYRPLKKLARAWPAAAQLPPHYQLGPCLYEVHTARQMLQPHPHLAVAVQGFDIVGVLVCFPDQHREQIFIQCCAVHPQYARDVDQSLQVLEHLVYAAVDLSLEYGWRGWVAYDALDAPHELLLALGFHSRLPFCYRKMGYFG